MTAISSSIGLERISRVSGYSIKKAFFGNDTANLPQILAIFAEANTANQGTLNTNKREVTSAEEAGRIYGYGSPIHQIMRILRPIGQTGIGGIPTIVFPQETDEDATATVIALTVTGTATKNATHYLRIAGRENLDYQPYSYNVQIGDTPTAVASKMAAAVNAVLGCPVTASSALGVITLTTKWKGKTSSSITIDINPQGELAGLTYAVTSTTEGAGSVDLSEALNQFGTDWYTGVINSYGEDTLAVLEQFNGQPSIENPTGRYSAEIFRPFMAFFGYNGTDKEEFAAITDAAARRDQVTNVLCPAPGSAAFPWEAAANVARLFARTMQDSPEKDVNGQSYPDMPVPVSGNIGDMSDYENRDFLVKKGCSNVILDKGFYKIQEIVTTYHPEGEVPLQFSYCRNLNLDWNIADSYKILEERRLKDRVLIRDEQVTDSPNAIKPKEWKAVLFDFFNDLAVSALINDPDFSKQSLNVQVSADNPNRFETTFKYKRTGIARVESTTVEAGF